MNYTNKTVNILGTEYRIIIENFKDNEEFERNSFAAYESDTEKEIHICDMSTYPEFERETNKSCDAFMKINIRHEIIHAFLSESGLRHCSVGVNDAWALNEEMVDWIAIQIPKMTKVMKDAGALD